MKTETSQTADISGTLPTAVVFGAAMVNGEPSPALLRRAAAAVDLWQAGRVSDIIVSGHQGEAEAMAEHISRKCDATVHIESKAANTFENLLFASRLADGPFVFVSDWYHLPRIFLVARFIGADGRGFCSQVSISIVLRQLPAALRELPAIMVYTVRLVSGRLI